MTTEIIIDTRESKIIQELRKTIEIKVEQLDLGDIVFKKDGKIVFIIERKTVDDLKASICDGRHREQKARLLGCGEISHNRIMYLIEGNLNKKLNEKISGFPVSSLVGSLINTQLRDNIKVYKTYSLKETVEFLKKLLVKLNSEDCDTFFSEETKVIDYSTALKKKKKENMTPYIWFIAQLSLIPQVTEKIGKEIVKQYPTIVDLVKKYESLESNLREKLLADITFPIKNNKVRRIGNVISSRIYNFIYNFSSVIINGKEK
jgi:crossover junction endonuclease MUS81